MKKIVADFLNRYEEQFANAIWNEAAHVMARKGSVFAPFTRIYPDQWFHFQNFIVTPLVSSGIPISTASIGPDGEKLYSIYIAPARHNRSDEATCRMKIAEDIKRSPNRPSQGTLADAQADYRKQFNLPAKLVEHLINEECDKAGDSCGWRRPGRPKSQGEIPQLGPRRSPDFAIEASQTSTNTAISRASKSPQKTGAKSPAKIKS